MDYVGPAGLVEVESTGLDSRRVTAETTSGAAVFVSYSRMDEGFVRRLDAALRERGMNVWVDWDDIPATADCRARIFTGSTGPERSSWC
jgi:hypothetical protein